MNVPAAGRGVVSVVVPCHDGLEFTRHCLAALARHTRGPWELIAVDDGSGDGTPDYLKGVRDVAPFPVTLVTRAEGLGLPAACNAGLGTARGEYLVLLASDTVVTDGWLEQLIALAEAAPAIGLAGPMSNDAPSPQLAEGAAYDDLEGMQAFAARWRHEHRGAWLTCPRLAGFCLLIKRRALEAVGGLDERLGEAAFDDLSMRARRAGFELAVARDLFVHRSGGRVLASASGAAPPHAGRAGFVAEPAEGAGDGPREAAILPRAGGPAATRIAALPRAEFARRYGDPDTARALCGYTPPADTHAILTLLAHARPRRVLEIGTAWGHMTANLTEWSPDDARVLSLGLVRGMADAGAPEQGCEAPEPAALGRLAGHFGKAHKAEIVAADSRGLDLAARGPFDFIFVDGGHDLGQALADSRAAHAALAPGGWLVWHDVGHPASWVRVREAIERAGFDELVEHVEGTMVAFLRKGVRSAVGDAGAGPPPRLTWEGDVDGLHSMGLINRALCRALLGRGVDLGLASGGPEVAPERLAPDPALEARRGRPPAGGPPHAWVAHRWPPRLEPPPQGRWAFFQPWEFGRLPEAWLPAATRADEVWAYSRAVREVYLEAGVPEGRVHLVPLGVDPDVFRPGREPRPLPPGPSFRFLFVGGTIHRKGIDLLLTAYERAFRPADGVGLVVQDMGSGSFYRGQTAGAAIAALRGRGYPVEHRESALAPDELAGLYAACDCVVQPYRGEGFALPVAEAMACGLPVIVTGAGPALDYASEATAYLIPARRVELPECRVGEFATLGRPWLWEPDVKALAEAMRRVASDPASARARGEAAARAIREGFTWAHSAAAVETRLRAMVGDEGRRSAARSIAPAKRRGASPRVSLTMIVRDEEANLPTCLGSVAGLFDEVVVVDTGSKDRTAEIARAHGARVFDFPWVDDFAAARNAALARATGDYAFWLDADDVVNPPERAKLEALLRGLRPGDEAAYVVRCACDPEPGGGGATVVDHVRLFPVREEVRWGYRVHEQILPSLRRAGVPVRWTDVVVRHTGYVDPALRGRKLERDSAILREELADRPDDPFVLFNLGSIAIERRDWPEALAHLGRSLALSAPEDSITRKLHALIARAHQGRGDSAAALAACASGLATEPDDAELLFRKAILHRHRGEPAEAEACWRRILGLRRPERFSSVDAGIYGHLTRRNLGLLAEERGDRAEARRQWEAVRAECPGDAEAAAALARLGDAGEGEGGAGS